MGHVRLGRLPRTILWQNVVGLIDDSPDNIPAVAAGTISATDARLRSLPTDPSLVYCYWLLTRITSASRDDVFDAALARLGLPVPASESALAYISQLSDVVREDLAPYTLSGPFGEIASLAQRRALSETIGAHGRSIFGSSVEDIQHAFRAHSTPTQFGELTRRFFGDYIARTLRYFVERDVSNLVGDGHALRTIEESRQFTSSLDRYARESTGIIEEFASDWYSKHNWEASGAISQEEVQVFIAVALRKLRSELKLAAQ